MPSVYCFTFFVSAVKNRFDLFLAWLPLPVFHGPSGFGLLTKDCDRSQTFSTRQTRQLRDSALDANFPLNTRARRARRAGERLRPRGARSPGLAGDAGEEDTQGPKVARKVSPRLPPSLQKGQRDALSPVALQLAFNQDLCSSRWCLLLCRILNCHPGLCSENDAGSTASARAGLADVARGADCGSWLLLCGGTKEFSAPCLQSPLRLVPPPLTDRYQDISGFADGCHGPGQISGHTRHQASSCRSLRTTATALKSSQET